MHAALWKLGIVCASQGEKMNTKRVLVCGAGGFIGGHLVKRLKHEGFWVRGVDLKHHEFSRSHADEFIIGDLRDPSVCRDVVSGIDEIYQLAADMGGAGYIFTGEHDAAIMRSEEHTSELQSLRHLVCRLLLEKKTNY